MSDEFREALTAGEQAGMRYALSLPRQTLAGNTGTALGQQAGSSLEFKDYREYQPGDDLRHIDWGAYARSDQLSVKIFREEVCPHVDIFLDVTRSMALKDTAKAKATVAMSAFFATAAINAVFTHATWTLGEQILPVIHGQSTPSSWEGIALEQCASPSESLLHSVPPWRSRGVRILISDLLWDCEPLSITKHLADGASAFVVLQVLAKADVEPPEPGNYRLVDTETQQIREIYIDATVQQRYREGLDRHQQNWHRACRQVGAIFSSVIAEEWTQHWQLDELVQAEILKVK